MILITLLNHQIKNTLRSKNLYGSVFKTIYWLILGVYLFVMLLALGFFVRQRIISGETSLSEFMGSIFPYFILGGLSIRILIASHAAINIDYYKTLPIKKSSLANFILIKPFINPINYGLCVFLLPTIFTTAQVFESGWESLNFFIITHSIIAFNILLSGYLSRKFANSIIPLIVSFTLTAGYTALQYYNIFPLSEAGKLFSPIFEMPFGFTPLLIGAIAIYLLRRKWLIKHCYAQSSSPDSNMLKVDKINLSSLESRGNTGVYLSLMLKLILRNKRTKSLIYILPLSILYGLILRDGDVSGGIIFYAIFVTGGLVFLFSTFVYSCNSKHFDGLMANKISYHSYIASYYYLLAASSLFCFLISLSYYFVNKTLFVFLLPACLYNIGVNTPFVLWVIIYFTRRLELNQGGALNMQGSSFKDIIFTIPIILLPMIFMMISSSFLSINTSLIIIGTIGMVGIILHRPLLRMITKTFIRRRHIIAESFRAK